MAAYAYADESEVDESAIEQELGLLQAIYVHELEIQTDDCGHPAVLRLTLHPSTADNVDLQYVCLTLVFTLSPEYPVLLPDIAIKNPRGISDEKITRLSNQLHQLATEKKGSAMLYELIEVAKESLTNNNTPYGQCVICLEDFKEGEAFTKTSCYHYFHSDCLGRYIQHALDNTGDNELEDKHAHQTKMGNEKDKNEVVCAVCRKPITYDLGQLNSTPRRQSEDVIYQPDTAMLNIQRKMATLYQEQSEKGGIIDIEAQSNKFLIDISVTPTRPMNIGIGSKALEEPVRRTITTSPVSKTQRQPTKEVNEEEDKKSEGRLDKKPQARHYSSDKGTRDGGKKTGTSYYRHDSENKKENRGRGNSRLTSAGRYEDRQYYRSNRRHWRDAEHRPVAHRDGKSGNVIQRPDETKANDAGVGSSAEKLTKSAVPSKHSADNSEQKASIRSSSNVQVNTQSKDIGAVEDSCVKSDEINIVKQTSSNNVCVQNGLDKRESSNDRYHEKSDTSTVKDTDDKRETNGNLEEDETVPSVKHGERSLGIDDGHTSNSTRLVRAAGTKDEMYGNISEQKQRQTGITYQRRDRNNHPRKEFKNNPREYHRHNRQWDVDDKSQIRSNKCINDNEKSRDGVRNHRRKDFDSKFVKRTDKIKEEDSRPRDCQINHRGMAVDNKTENKRDMCVGDDNRQRDGQRIVRSDFHNKPKKVTDSGTKHWEKKENASSRQDRRKASEDSDKLLNDIDLRTRSSVESTAGCKEIVGTCGKGRGQSTWNRRKYPARNRSDVERDVPRSGRGLVDTDVKSHGSNATSYIALSERPSENHVNHNGMQTPLKSKQSLKSSKEDSLPSWSDSRVSDNKEVKKPLPPPGFQQPPAKEGHSSVFKPPPGFKDFS